MSIFDEIISDKNADIESAKERAGKWEPVRQYMASRGWTPLKINGTWEEICLEKLKSIPDGE